MEASTAERPEETTEGGNKGRIEEIQGVVIEVAFPENLPEINNAITIQRPDDGGTLVCEVQQHLGDDRIRAVAMDATDGLARGMEVDRHRRPDHRAGRQGHARPHVQRARRR